LSGGVKKGARYTADKFLNLQVPDYEQEPIQFGFTEIILILLFAVGYFAHKKTFKYTKAARWTTMLVGLVVLGFVYNQPVTLSQISMLLLGYFPDFRTHLYWYLLLSGIFFVFTIDNKNPYCQWFCPFGAAQECLGIIGGAKARQAGRFNDFLKWLPRLLTLTAVLLALFFRNPGISSYEVFGTLFDFTGSNLQFAVLGIILLTSLFIKRPWCKYLCPLRPVMDAHRIFRNGIKNLWKKRLKKAAA
jgi:polyferredoxin